MEQVSTSCSAKADTAPAISFSAFLPFSFFLAVFWLQWRKILQPKVGGRVGGFLKKAPKECSLQCQGPLKKHGPGEGREKVEEVSLSPLGTGKTLSPSLSTWGQWHDLTLISKGPTGWWIGNTQVQSRHREPSLTPGRNNRLARWLQRRFPDELLASCYTLCCPCVMTCHHLRENKTKLVLLSMILPKRPSGHREGAIQRHRCSDSVPLSHICIRAHCLRRHGLTVSSAKVNVLCCFAVLYKALWWSPVGEISLCRTQES